MAATYLNGWYVSADQYEVGPSSGTPTAEQINNATLIYNTFSSLGWTLTSIAGMLGNMMYESCLDPACVYPKSGFPNQGATLADLDNSYAINIPNSAYGLVQWRGTTTTPPPGNQLVSYAIRHNTEWYEGQIQMDRLTWEYQDNKKWHSKSVYGTTWTWSNYTTDQNITPEQAAIIFMRCYEDTDSVRSIRQANARYWYDYFSGVTPGPPTPPTPTTGWVSGETFANIAYGYKDSGYTYDQYDCIGFVNLCWQNIDSPPKTESLTNGTNSIWRSTRQFLTTDPFGNDPTTELWWKGTIEDCTSQFGFIPQGALLFKCIPEGQPGYDTIPPEYYGDGIGNFTHVGIYVAPLGGEGSVMQSGGYGGTGVHLSGWQNNYWTHVAFVVYVYAEDGPEPPEPEDYTTDILIWYNMLNNKGGVKRVRRF